MSIPSLSDTMVRKIGNVLENAATHREFTSDGVKREVTDYHRIVTWGKLAEICAAYLTKGTGVYVATNPSVLTVQNATDINAGNTYFNIHSANNLCPPATSCAAGEIRGQIAVQ